MREEVLHGRGEIGVRFQEPRGMGDDAVPIVIGVGSPGDVEAILHRDESLHREGRRAIHPDLAIPVQRHKAEGRIHLRADNLERDAILFGDLAPVGHTGATEWIDPIRTSAARMTSKSMTDCRSVM